MAKPETVAKIKTDRRISHSALDDDIADTVDACLADLKVVGVTEPSEEDALILAAVKLYCRAMLTDDTDEAAAYTERYNAMKGTLMMAEGYGGAADE
mgnify:CR=1 FL=1